MKLAAMILLVGLTGCALTTDYVDVTYGTARPQQPIAGAQNVGLTMVSADGRTDRRDRVSSKRNGFGMDMAPIIATGDIVAETGRAISSELTAKGFRVGQDAQIKVEVIKFYNEFRAGFFAGDAVSEITLNVQVVSRTGQIVYSRVYTAQGLEPNIQVTLGHNAQASLNDGLRKIVPQVVDDPALLSALLSQAAYSVPAPYAPTS